MFSSMNVGCGSESAMTEAVSCSTRNNPTTLERACSGCLNRPFVPLWLYPPKPSALAQG